MKIEYISRAAKNLIPWRLRYLLKVAEAKHPGLIPSAFKQKSDSEYYNNCFYTTLEVMGHPDFKDRTYCEMGPGQFLSHAFLAYQLGAKESYLLEIDDFANQDDELVISKYLILPDEKGRIRKLPKPRNRISLREYLRELNSHYFTDGLAGYKRVPENSVDYVFSYSVIEHIRKKEFYETMQEVYRFLRNGGACYHTVDLSDHLGGAKNQLRFSDIVWEDEIHYRMDNYTNRLSFSEICQIWTEIGFDVDVVRKLGGKLMNRKLLNPEFRNISDEDLKTQSFIVILKKSTGAE